MRHKQNKKKLLIAILLAIAAFLAVYSSMNSQKATITTLSQQIEEQQKTITQLKESSSGMVNSVLGLKVVVAKQDIKAGTKLTPDMMELKDYTDGKPPDDAIKDINTLLEQVVSEDIKAGNLITRSKTLGLRVTNLEIPSGMRAITIPANYVQGLASYITVGSKIDLVAVKKDNNPTFVLQGVKIISLESGGAASTGVSSSKAEAITLLIPVDSVPRVVDAMVNGKLQVVARGFGDNSIVRNHVHISRVYNDNYSSSKFTLPPPPSESGIKLTGINDIKPYSASTLPPIKFNGRKVEVIQANVKSEVEFSNNL